MQQVYRLDCSTLLVLGYAPLASTLARQVSFTLQLLNASVPSPCGDVFAGASLTATVQTRCAFVSLSGRHMLCTFVPCACDASSATFKW